MGKKGRVRVGSAMLAGAMFFITRGASAWDKTETTLSPTACVADGSASFSKLWIYPGKILNGSGSGTANIWCPVPQVTATEFLGAPTGTTAVLYYVDYSSNVNLSCTYHWSNISNGAPFWSWSFTSNYESNKFVVDDPEVFSGSQTWYCSLPASTSVYVTGHVFSLYRTEWDPGG